MISTMNHPANQRRSRPWARLIVQLFVSFSLLALLVSVVHKGKLVEQLRSIEATGVVAAVALLLIACALNSYRWQLHLRCQKINERFGILTAWLIISYFFSLFLPTSAGGDVFRIYEVGKRSGKPGLAFLGTVQERFLGLGATLLMGLFATFCYFSLFPAHLRLAIVGIQLVGILGVAFVFYPRPWIASARRWQGLWQVLREQRSLARLLNGLRFMKDAQPLSLFQFAPLLGWAFVAVLLGVGMYYFIGRSLHIPIGFFAYCLVVPLVWVVQMLPISLNGIGVREAAFVYLMGLFSVPSDKSLALVLAVLGILTTLSLCGGILLVARMIHGTWIGIWHLRAPMEFCGNAQQTSDATTSQETEIRHAA